MANTKSFSAIVSTMIERLSLVQPNLDTKPGSVARDLFVDLQADEIEKVYKLISIVSEKQSFATASGRDLDRLAANFGITRKSGAGASGVVVFVTSDLSGDIPIPAGSIVTARNGVSFRTIGAFAMLGSDKNRYAANANRLRGALNVAGITDTYALEVPVEAITVGTSGNISSYQIINSDSVSEISVTNLTAFTGGAGTETDSEFRSRFLATFSGSNTGTSLGYRNAVLGVNGVLDALVVEPGNTLMLRDGTETIETNNVSRILNSGTGGKVDIYVLGTILNTISESFIFRNKSYTGDITDSVNDHILGNFNQDFTLTSEERKYNAFKNGSLPFQPISSVISLTGSSSGVLTQATLNEDGTYNGNYILSKDLNADTGGSPFGFDKIKFVSNVKKVSGETINKFGNNISDNLSFSNIDKLSSVYQDIIIVDENSSISATDNSIIYLKKSPIVKISNVTNFTTGEIYVVEESNIDETAGLNLIGYIKISGKNLPSISDKLKVTYTWRKYFDEYLDYAKSSSSVNWKGNDVDAEETILQRDPLTGAFSVQVDNKISKVDSVYLSTSTTGTVSLDGSSKIVDLSSFSSSLTSVVSIKTSAGMEIYNTEKADGTFVNKIIYLPTDSGAIEGESVSLVINKIELYNLENNDGTFNNSTIELPELSVLEAQSLLSIVTNAFFTERTVYVDYSLDIINLIPSISFSNLPISKSENLNTLTNNAFATIANSRQPIEYIFVDDVKSGIYRYSPSALKMTTSGIVSQGKISVEGVSANRMQITVFAGNTYNGSLLSIKSEIQSMIGQDFNEQLFISKVNEIKIGTTNVDVNGYSIKTNTYDLLKSRADSSLNNFEIKIDSAAQYSSGTEIYIDFYLSNPTQTEEVYFYKNESRFTNNTFFLINKINVVSGFRNTSNVLFGNITISQYNQPDSGTVYLSDYQFKAPIDGERITVQYNVNNLIRTATSALETVRPVTADVLVKEAQELIVDASGTIVVNEDFLDDSDSVVESVNNAVANLLNSGRLGDLIDYSDIIQVITSIAGVDSANVSLFNYSGEAGRRSYVKSLDNQTISPGVISFTAVSRNNFRIS